MATYKVQKSPFNTLDVESVEADRYEEQGSYTKFFRGDKEVFSIRTELVTAIDVSD